MVSNYGKYVKEREGKEIIEGDWGFATYLLEKDLLYVVDVYVVPEKRRKGLAKSIFNKLEIEAKNKNKSHIATSLDTTTNNWEVTMQGLIKHGYGMRS